MTGVSQSEDGDLDYKHNEHFVKTLFIPYIHDVYKDLAERAKQQEPGPGAMSGINRLTFLQFLNLPGILGERLFKMCSSTGQVTLVEFRKLMQKIFYSRVETKLSLVFDLYDFDCDGLISSGDIMLILLHVPLEVQPPTFQDRVNSHNSLLMFTQDLQKFMGGKT